MVRFSGVGQACSLTTVHTHTARVINRHRQLCTGCPKVTLCFSVPGSLATPPRWRHSSARFAMRWWKRCVALHPHRMTVPLRPLPQASIRAKLTFGLEVLCKMELFSLSSIFSDPSPLHPFRRQPALPCPMGTPTAWTVAHRWQRAVVCGQRHLWRPPHRLPSERFDILGPCLRNQRISSDGSLPPGCCRTTCPLSGMPSCLSGYRGCGTTPTVRYPAVASPECARDAEAELQRALDVIRARIPGAVAALRAAQAVFQARFSCFHGESFCALDAGLWPA